MPARESHPPPTQRAYHTLGLHHSAAVERCYEVFDRLSSEYDPRRWPNDPATQHRIIGHQDDLDEALALVVDASSKWGGPAA